MCSDHNRIYQSLETITLEIEESLSHMETDLPLSIPVTFNSAFDVVDKEIEEKTI